MRISASAVFFALVFLVEGQNPDITDRISQFRGSPTIAVPDFRGAGDAQPLMNAFNTTLWDELSDSGGLKMAAKNLYPLVVPQQPQDFKRPGPWLTDWSSAPVSANNLAFGYASVQDGRLVLAGWLFNLSQPDPVRAKVFGTLYYGTLDEAGAKKVAHEFAADILRQFNIKTLTGTKIYFASDRSGQREIWAMDPDGSNQQPVTQDHSNAKHVTVSPDAKLLAYTTLVQRKDGAPENWQIVLRSTDTRKRQSFQNPQAPTNGWAEFTPDGQHLLFGSTLSGWAQIYISNLDGSSRRALTNSKSMDLSPRVNPKTGADVIFISDRSGKQQLWRMHVDGSDLEMLTSGVGEVANPCWSPDGQMVAFAWTQGYEIGAFNIFIMDIAERKPIQVTKDSGVNENPWWAPDGLHIVYSSRRGGTTQIFSILADGRNSRQLTKEGNNIQPVWAKSIN